MPELPEVETIKNILAKLVIGKKISNIEIFNRNTIEGDPSDFAKTLRGKTISKLTRIGKFLIFHLDEEIVFLSHLRMEGKYFYHEQMLETYDKHACVVFTFSDHSALEYNDTRKFGLMKLSSASAYQASPPLSNLGPEPFDIKDIKPLLSKLARKKIPIKAVLLDQTFMAGLGNIYVDEVLYLSLIHPETPAYRISESQLQEIIENSIKVLSMAIKSGGSTIRSYHPSQGIDGGFQTQLNAYGKENLPCPRCNHGMRKIFVGGRGTTFCPRCQKNPSLPYVIGITGPIGSGKSSVLSFFGERGYLTLSGDTIVKDLYQDKKVQESIVKLFGNNVVDESGNIDKRFIVDVIIADEHKKRRLEKILHPRVEKAVVETLKKAHNDDKIAIEMPLLFEAKLDDYCDETIYVDIKDSIQAKRLAERRLPLATLRALNTGFDALRDKEKATYVVDNSSSLSKLYKQLKRILR